MCDCEGVTTKRPRLWSPGTPNRCRTPASSRRSSRKSPIFIRWVALLDIAVTPIDLGGVPRWSSGFRSHARAPKRLTLSCRAAELVLPRAAEDAESGVGQAAELLAHQMPGLNE